MNYLKKSRILVVLVSVLIFSLITYVAYSKVSKVRLATSGVYRDFMYDTSYCLENLISFEEKTMIDHYSVHVFCYKEDTFLVFDKNCSDLSYPKGYESADISCSRYSFEVEKEVPNSDIYVSTDFVKSKYFQNKYKFILARPKLVLGK